MAHQSNSHLSAASRAKISEKLRADEALKRAAREARKLEREIERKDAKALKELQHLEHERLKHESHGYSPAERQKIANEIHRTEQADSTEISARAANKYRHELETRTYKPPHRRNRH